MVRRCNISLILRWCLRKVSKWRCAILLLASFFVLYATWLNGHCLTMDSREIVGGKNASQLFRMFGSIPKQTIVSNRSSDERHELDIRQVHYAVSKTDVCEKQHSPFIVIFVPSHPLFFKRRMVLRKFWNLYSQKLHNFAVVLLFIVGRYVADLRVEIQVSLAVDAEEGVFHDILKGTFEDTYGNLLLKSILMLKWTTEHCPKATLIMKMDDDAVIDYSQLSKTLERFESPKRTIICHVWTDSKPRRNARDKWFLPDREYNISQFKPYCSGSAYLISGDSVPLLYRKAMTCPVVWLEDLHITGNLASELQLRLVDVRFYRNFHNFYDYLYPSLRYC
ncbi:unnamed protein product [Soboliphyme baturini]|uniref:Hexosyltransferase n=1 Tax=Soboliphyme baturini TaxID=241478 RepID=A0A183ID19_9BILA|nr:unnamed protein product [Soboliphyme baturini]